MYTSTIHFIKNAFFDYLKAETDITLLLIRLITLSVMRLASIKQHHVSAFRHVVSLQIYRMSLKYPSIGAVNISSRLSP